MVPGPPGGNDRSENVGNKRCPPAGRAARSRPESVHCEHGLQLCRSCCGHWKDRRIWAHPGERSGQSEGLSCLSGPGTAPNDLGNPLNLLSGEKKV